MRQFNLGTMLPIIHLFENEYIDEDKYWFDKTYDGYKTSLLIFPLEANVTHFFLNKDFDARKNLYLMFKVLNFHEFGFISITYRKCIMETSVKGINFTHLEISKLNRLRKTDEKFEALKELE